MKQTSSRRFNSVDFFVIMLAIAAVLSLILQGNLARSIALEDVGEACEYTLLLSAQKADQITLIRAGDELVHAETGEVLGKVRTVRRENTVRYAIDEQGGVAPYADADFFDLTLTVSTTGKMRENGFFLNGTIPATAGDTLPLATQGDTVLTALVLG
ncbi:MAG: DUF4330 family protein [Clostridia bacterium]|nr:DUF4330 family protein [Clostridia bacterium]